MLESPKENTGNAEGRTRLVRPSAVQGKRKQVENTGDAGKTNNDGRLLKEMKLTNGQTKNYKIGKEIF